MGRLVTRWEDDFREEGRGQGAQALWLMMNFILSSHKEKTGLQYFNFYAIRNNLEVCCKFTCSPNLNW